jgi:hypothetical protein
MIKNYAGWRLEDGEIIVEVHEGEKTSDLLMRPDIPDHIFTGFQWGNSGTRAIHLALAILADFTEKPPDPPQYQLFKAKFIQNIKEDLWVIKGEDITRFLNAYNINGNLDGFLQE